MLAFRIYNKKHDPLNGAGAAMVGGRWNPIGTPVIYAARTYEGALLEQLVHAGIGRLPSNRLAAQLHIPDDVPMDTFPTDEVPNWATETVSQGFAGEWLTEGASLVLLVPSVVARPWGVNLVLNPNHGRFSEVSVVEVIEVQWDSRLVL